MGVYVTTFPDLRDACCYVAMTEVSQTLDQTLFRGQCCENNLCAGNRQLSDCCHCCQVTLTSLLPFLLSPFTSLAFHLSSLCAMSERHFTAVQIE